MMKFPARLIDRGRLDAFLEEVDCVRLRDVGANLILNIARDELEFEDEIERRNSVGYGRATTLLSDLRALAEEQGTIEAFLRRLVAIRERHARKERFIERLTAIGLRGAP
jgi:hypothetical protein